MNNIRYIGPTQDDDFIHAAHAMKSGGSFSAAIAEAYFCADKDNRGRLRKAFPELFSKFYSLHVREAIREQQC